MLNEELARQRQQTLKHEHREFVNAARKAWKDAIEERRTQLELADIKVAALHEAFKQAKELTFEEWKVLNDRQSS
jgi:methylphosphotriester-DNA--protein-cysteine methyltransferase